MAKKHTYSDDELIDTGINKRKKSKKRKAPKAAPSGSVSAKNRVNVDFAENERPVNRYYLAVAGRFRAARYVSFILLAAFLSVMLLFYRDSITYSNLMYLVRDLDSGTGVMIGAYSNITYEEQYRRSFSMFRGRIASVSSTAFNLYSSTGSLDISDGLSYTSPAIDAGDKYALVYDAGGNSYSVYTSISRVLSATADNTIEDGCVGSDGHFALLTRSENSKYLITVYDAGFRPVTKYYKDKYVLDMALNKKGTEIACVSAFVNSSDITCEIMLGKVGTEESSVIELKSQMPLSCRYAEDGTLMLLCDRALVAVRDGDIAWQKDISGSSPAAFWQGEDMFALAVSLNAIGSENEIFVFDTEGNVLYNNKISKKVSFITGDGDGYIYTVGEGSADRVSLSDGSIDTEEISGRILDALGVPGCLIICMPDGTNSLFCGE